MSLADLHTPGTARRGGTCTVAKILARLDDTDRAWLTAVLADPDEHSSTIGRTLTTAGHKIAGTTVSRHRRGDCAC